MPIGPAPDVRLPWIALAALCVVATLVAYGPVLDNYFYEIDDSILLDAARRGLSSTPQFRPLFGAWNALLYTAFGTAPAGYYAAGLLVHALNAFLLGALVRQLCRRWLPAFVAALVFATFFAPCEAVLWISANCGLISLACVLCAALAWLAHLDGAGRRGVYYVLALLATAAAALCKQEAVIALPLLLGLDVLRRGSSSLATRGACVRYLPFAVLALAYLPLAFTPRDWLPGEPEHRFAIEAKLALELWGNFALLFAFGHSERSPLDAPLVAVGLALAVTFAALAWRWRSRLLAFGVAVAVFGLLPPLPGPFAIAGSRLAYPSSVGIALMAAALTARAADVRALRCGHAVRIGAALALAAWVAVQVYAVHAIESWRYGKRAARFERLMARCGAILRELGTEAMPVERVAFLAPPIWNARDFECALPLFHPEAVIEAYGERAGHASELERFLLDGAPSTELRVAVFVPASGDSFRRLHRADAALSDGAWQHLLDAAPAVRVVWCELRRLGAPRRSRRRAKRRDPRCRAEYSAPLAARSACRSRSQLSPTSNSMRS